ncbi:glycosyltransferase family 2 protein [Rhizobium sp. YIM 134829]|uniref:glycosyltransferase family 2 protein n=1 Tax=Rhizobium sp. YIM 134829 TaxID=3390453 RepID=UPI00397DA81E
MDPLIITLSTIPPRFRDLDRTLGSLLDQHAPARDIRLHIPLRYKRYHDWDGRLPRVPQGVTLVRTAFDYGPATKILPAVREFRNQPVELLLCDDDRIYDPGWTKRFLAARSLYPSHVITEDGGQMARRSNEWGPRATPRRKDWRFRMNRAVTFGAYRPPKWVQSGFVDVFKGYSGVLLKPDFLPAFAFDIPDILWTVDDVWLSGCLAANGVGIWVNANAPLPREARAARKDPLLRFSHRGHDRRLANRACRTWFQDNLGIWTAQTPRGAGTSGSSELIQGA